MAPVRHPRTLIGKGGFLVSAKIYNPSTGEFGPTGRMTTGKQRPSATLLPDGKVLVVGGGGGRDQANAELFDPATGEFFATGQMVIPRRGDPLLVPLRRGKVLVIGGFYETSRNLQGYTASAELYDPSAGEFTPTGQMVTPRTRHATVRLRDGRVWVMGGDGPGNYHLSSAELYDPATGRFAATDCMVQPRVHLVATLLSDGKVLVTGGNNNDASSELYDPTTGR